jgi:hypothetical protein
VTPFVNPVIVCVRSTELNVVGGSAVHDGRGASRESLSATFGVSTVSLTSPQHGVTSSQLDGEARSAIEECLKRALGVARADLE